MKTPLQRIYQGAIVLVLVFLVAVVGYHSLGGYDWISAIWMVVITISTVGYGEQSSLTPGLKLFTVSVILLGISAAAYTFGGLFQLIMEGELDRAIGRKRMTRDLNNIRDHVIVCGYGRMGRSLTHELLRQGKSLVAVDIDPSIMSEANPPSMIVFTGDATEESTLIAVGIHRAKSLVISMPNDAESVFITLTARELNPNLQILARAEKHTTVKKLTQAGANKIVMPTVVGAQQMVRMLTRPNTADLLELVSQSEMTDMELDEVHVGQSSDLVGVTVEQSQAHNHHRLLIVATKQTGQPFQMVLDHQYAFQAGDIVMILGHAEDIAAFRKQHRLGPLS